MASDERQALLAPKESPRQFEERKLLALAEKHVKTSLIRPITCGCMVFGCLLLLRVIASSYSAIATPSVPAQSGSSTNFNYTCMPFQACWPTSNEWAALNRTLTGNLKLTVPWAEPCYTGSAESCQEVKNVYMNSTARTSQYGAMEFLDWEQCGQSSCMLNSFAPSTPVHGTCSLGRLSTYHVEAYSADDVKSTLDFVKAHNMRLSIKNSGHDYFGRSNLANSLAIWTRNLKSTVYHSTFQPKGCMSTYENVGEIGAGISAQEAWEFFEPLGMLVTVGASGSVGIAGGFGQGGGHGPLAPKYGLMVDNAIEFEVVTADGQTRTINECSDPDLFWAMRGGGGGTFAVLTSYKFQLHPAVPLNVFSFQANFSMPNGQLDITQSAVHRDVIRALASSQPNMAAHGIAGYNFLLPDHMLLLQILPSADSERIKDIVSDLHEFLTGHPELEVIESAFYTFHKFSEWHRFTQTPVIAHNGPVGLGIAESGRFLPSKLFQTPGAIEKIVDAVVTAMQFSLTNNGGGAAQLYATGPFNQPEKDKTGVNPAWRDAMWEVIMGGFWTSSTSDSVRNKIRNTISASIEPFKALTPGGGCYMNEGDWLEENWQQTFFGSNYDRLLQIKRRYDPSGLFNCWKCVGWSGYEE